MWRDISLPAEGEEEEVVVVVVRVHVDSSGWIGWGNGPWFLFLLLLFFFFFFGRESRRGSGFLSSGGGSGEFCHLTLYENLMTKNIEKGEEG